MMDSKIGSWRWQARLVGTVVLGGLWGAWSLLGVVLGVRDPNWAKGAREDWKHERGRP